jgi:hypothetical protein
MKDSCAIKDDKFWNATLMPGETVTGFANNTLHLKTIDGFIIKIKLMDFGPKYFNGYVRVPTFMHHLRSWIEENPGYDDMNHELDLNVELTYFNDDRVEYGWDHCHSWDADFGKPLASQSGKDASGPVQVLEEARAVIKAMMDKEQQMLQDKKREEMEVIREELMMKACHPRRIAIWTEAGFDPFDSCW